MRGDLPELTLRGQDTHTGFVSVPRLGFVSIFLSHDHLACIYCTIFENKIQEANK